MNIAQDCVVSFHYRLVDADGTVLEDSHAAQQPVAYLHGHSSMIPGLEREMAGKAAKDTLTVTLEQPYGPYRPERVQRVPIKHLATSETPVVGQPTVVNTAHGRQEVMVVKVGRFNVDVDSNHPYAGKTLTYEIEIQNVLEATAEELDHQHAHGPGGHQH